ncbi:PaaA family phenylacetate degradation enoyl-CoA hydratase [Buttiauxella gaviniae ATCC 51604]|uniref:PaaA family phenylacetate degradation enoyl-CoA hydratase n=1 Tax=Buttiauxella gaviniae ATCC 51604 TaxID=1354253 RepID=A0A1B7HMJ4_9ENTR|nr:2,3-dehydroadipyl-CoA hydratase PaaF [Buttiauxella gaviniae]OAT16833.1 PaaA family phenylacetate degradation enoyl-CoA hydratase [Buttiauxella gaviniae ATCC 51604]
MSELLVSQNGRVLTLTLNRPEARNALNNALLDQIALALEAAQQNESTGAVVITGNDRFFAAGADLKEMASLDMPATLNDPRPQLWARIERFNKPLLAAVNGYALGAGCELAMLCDIVMAGDNARFGLPEITLGIMPGAGGTQRLIRSVGKAMAYKMVLTGKAITAQQAQQAGLVAEMCPAALTLEYSEKLAARIAQHAPLALQAAKTALRQAHELSLSQGLAHERQLFTLLAATEDRQEGIAAFLEKRPAAFKGR